MLDRLLDVRVHGISDGILCWMSYSKATLCFPLFWALIAEAELSGLVVAVGTKAQAPCLVVELVGLISALLA